MSRLGEALRRGVERRWYGRPGALLLLRPLECLFAHLGRRRRRSAAVSPSRVPLAVVGNITVGGTGKTPVLMALVNACQARGVRVGVVSRGYGRADESRLVWVTADSRAEDVGDEALLIWQKTQCPVVVCACRTEAVAALVNAAVCDLIISDDGLQHYPMARDLEIAVVDGGRLFGNGHLLPVGPLREPRERLRDVDWVLVNMPADTPEPRTLGLDNSHTVRIEATGLTHLHSGAMLPLDELRGQSLVALAGIGNPEKFFATLRALGLDVEPRIFPDHHCYTRADFTGLSDRAVVMTEKDAVKCRDLAGERTYVLNVELRFPEMFLEAFFARLNALQKNAREV